MSCSYEQYEEVLAPSRFYVAGLSVARAVMVAIVPVAFALSAGWWVSRWPIHGFCGFAASIGLSAFVARRWSLNYWSQQAGHRLRTLKERNVFIAERRVDALLAFYDSDIEVALEGVDIDLSDAEKELAERRTARVGLPRWFGTVMLALIGAALTLLSKAPWQKAVLVLGEAALFLTVVLSASLVLGDVFDSNGNRFAGYVRFLRLGKRRLRHQVLKAKRALRRVA